MENEANMENKKYDESRIYYVYKHIRLDNNTCFYIGKGKDGRKDVPNRNLTHDSICDRHGYKVVIFKDKLNEAEAFKLEEDLIRCYVFKMGYGICIKGYMNNNNKFLTNRTFGGEGASGYKHSEESKRKNSESHKGKKQSEETKEKISEKVSGEKNGMFGKKGKDSPVYGEKNGMFGKNPFENKTEEEMETIVRKISEKNKGKNPYVNKTEEEMEIIRGKMSESHKGKQTGKNNPFYGKHHSEESKQKMSESNKGKNSFENKTKEEMETIGKKISEACSKKVICITTGEIFNSIKKAGNYYNVAKNTISFCCKKKYKSAGKLNGVRLQWKYLEDYNNDFKGILINPIIE